MTEDMARILEDLRALDAGEVFDLEADSLGDRLIDETIRGIVAHFDAEADPDGARWPELAPATVREKARLWPGSPMLVRTGTLRDGIAGDADVSGSEATYTYGTGPADRELAAWMHEGDPLANRPPRKFVDLTPESTAAADDLLGRAFDERFPR